MADEIRVPAQPGTDYAEMLLYEEHGNLRIAKSKRSNRGIVYPQASLTLSKHQQLALRDWLCNRWGGPERG